ncbi:hypothetical protein IFM89_023130 [Coptis chinensis]|uniref:Protein kinase domain-containing protein n=1 Tax=Coptis chinensis TaxID=261450 RepID=A0A835HXC5_9MAGN|nr:hypothetical protein IFM89_023130 [Coptis chinensis]
MLSTLDTFSETELEFCLSNDESLTAFQRVTYWSQPLGLTTRAQVRHVRPSSHRPEWNSSSHFREVSSRFWVQYPFRLNSGDRVIYSKRFIYSGDRDIYSGDGYIYYSDGDDTIADEGYPGLVLKCLNSRLVISISNHFYHVRDIDYDRKVFQIVDVDIVDEPDCPQPRTNVSLQSTPFLHAVITSESNLLYDNMTFFYNCTNNTQNVKQSLPCLDKYNNNNNNNNNNTNLRSYALLEADIPKGFNGYKNCLESVVVPFTNAITFDDSIPVLNQTQGLKQGFQLSWSAPTECQDCENSGGRCQYNGTGFRRCRKFMSSLCSCWRDIMESLENEEVSSENYKCGPQRYNYSTIKKMTNYFKETLGKGGYGCVFKGQLHDGRLVAVKVLIESKGNGEDFVNEVSTIGRTNHVNVVSLLGFCIEKTKRALVYEFMPNGSLERFIYKENESSFTPPLGSEKLYQIALGIARGLEYLHRGCNTRILHFDIKPHNILLDKDFCPKISDFGLAKLCPTRDVSVMSMAGARGTIGYIAPEFCFRNFGGVSHKSDVYSYGMMVFEMIGERKNINTKVENMSEIYFPQWVYNHLKPDFSIEGPCEVFEEETTKKMIVVALWCIQTHPTYRPSMTKVVEMLEGNNEELEMPPNPFLHPTVHSSTLSS